MLDQITEKKHVSEITTLQNNLQRLEQQIEVLQNCRAMDSRTIEDLRRKNAILQAENQKLNQFLYANGAA